MLNLVNQWLQKQNICINIHHFLLKNSCIDTTVCNFKNIIFLVEVKDWFCVKYCIATLCFLWILLYGSCVIWNLKHLRKCINPEEDLDTHNAFIIVVLHYSRVPRRIRSCSASAKLDIDKWHPWQWRFGTADLCFNSTSLAVKVWRSLAKRDDINQDGIKARRESACNLRANTPETHLKILRNAVQTNR